MTIRHAIACLLVASLTGCDGGSATEPSALVLRVTSASQSAPADAPTLYIDAELTNTSRSEYTAAGCMRPYLAIDSLAGSTWVPMAASQSEELMTCILGYRVSPGTTGRFTTTFQRTVVGWFPRGVPLRLRVIGNFDEPRTSTAVFILAR